MRTPRMLVLLTLLFCMYGAMATGDSLQLIWDNKLLDAQTAAKATLHTQPDAVPALHTLALVTAQEDAAQPAMEALARYTLAAAGSWQAEAYWSALVTMTKGTGRWSYLATVGQKLLATPQTSPHLRTAIHLALAQAAINRNALAEADAIYADLGYVRNWMITGPFDNVSHSGFDQAFPPEQAIDYHAQFHGINQRAISWLRLGFVTPDGVCLVHEAIGCHDAAIYYAVTAVNSPKTQSVYLRLDRNGAMKVLLNGAEVFRDERYQTRADDLADTYLAPVTLQAGWNTLVVKLATNDETSTTDFRLRVTDAAGQALAGLSVDPAHAVGAHPAQGGKSPAAESVWLTALTHQPASPEVALAGAALELSFGEKQLAIDRLLAALKQWPQVGLLHWALSQAYSQDDQDDEAQAERNEARKLTKCLALAELAEVQSQHAGLTEAEYEKQMQALCKQFPESDTLRWELSDLYIADEKTIEGIQAAKAAVALAPGAANRERLISVFKEDGRDADVETTLTQALALFPHDSELLNTRIERLQEKKAKRDILQVRRQIERVEGVTPSLRMEIADQLENLDDRQGSEAMLRTLREECPYNTDVCKQLATLLETSKRKTESAALLQCIIDLDPSETRLREKVQDLLGQKTLLELIAKTPADPIIAKAKLAKTEGDASVVVYLDELREVLYPDFSSESESHQILKICTDEGAKNWREANSEIMEGDMKVARIYKTNGKVINCAENQYGPESGLSKLEKGDILEFVKHNTDSHPGSLARNFWTTWRVTAYKPIQLSRYVLMTPSTLPLTTRSHGRSFDPVVTTVKGWKQYEWKATDLPAEKNEPMAPEGIDDGTWIDISTVPTWREIVVWYQRLAGQICVPDAAVRKKAQELTKDAKTETEKLHALVTFVSNEIEYAMSPGEGRESGYTPMKGQKVLRLKQGDCKGKAALLIALLDVVGIKADMVLVNTRDDGITPRLPSTRFTHAIVCIYTEKGPLYTDATAAMATLDSLPLPDQGMPALLINDHTTELMTLPLQPVDLHLVLQETKGTLDTDGKFTGAYTFGLSGFQAAQIRELLKKVPAEKYKELLRQVLTNMLPTAVLQSGTINDIKDLEKPLAMTMQVSVDHQAAIADDLFIVHLPTTSLAARVNTIFTEQTRTKDIELGTSYGTYLDRTTLTLPEGYAPLNMPARAEVTSPWGSYTGEYRLDGRTLTITLSVKLTSPRVPATDSPKFQEFLKGVNAVNSKWTFALFLSRLGLASVSGATARYERNHGGLT